MISTRGTLRLNAAAKYAGVSKKTILNWIEDGDLRARWDPRTGWRVTPADLDRALAEEALAAA